MIFDAIIISDNNSKFTTWLLIGQFNRTIYVCLYVFQYNTCRYELFGYLRNILLIQYHKRKHRISSMRRHYIQFLLRVHPKIYKNEMDPNLCVFFVFLFQLCIHFLFVDKFPQNIYLSYSGIRSIPRESKKSSFHGRPFMLSEVFYSECFIFQLRMGRTSRIVVRTTS